MTSTYGYYAIFSISSLTPSLKSRSIMTLVYLPQPRMNGFEETHHVDHPAALSFHRKLLRTLWCLVDSKTSLCSLLCRLSSLSLWLLIIQTQTDLRSSAAAVDEKQGRWRSSTRPATRMRRGTTFKKVAFLDEPVPDLLWTPHL